MGRQSPELNQALWRLVEREKAGDVLAPVTVIAPNQYANLSLRQELGRAGFGNVRFMVMPRLSELLGAALLERQGRKPLTSVLETLMLRQTLAETTGPLARVGQHPSTQISVRGVFTQLRNSDDQVRTTLATRPGVVGDVVRMYDAFRARAGDSWFDSQDLAAAAAEAVEQDEAPGLDDLGLIVFHLLRDATPAEARLIESLAAKNRAAALLGITGDEVADEPTQALASRLQPVMGTPIGLDGDGDGDGDGDEPPILPAHAELHIAPNAHEELRWVIRQIVDEMERNGTPLHRMAVLYRMANPYAALIRDELRMAGIPMAGPDRETLANTAAGRTLQGLLALSEGRFQRSEVMQWLNGCPVRPRSGVSRDLNPSHWDSITRKAGIVGGLEQWRHRLGAHARRLVNEADRREQAGEISVARARGMRAEAQSANSILAFIEKLVEDLKPPQDGSSWRDFADWARRLLDEYLADDIIDAESAARDSIHRSLDEFNAADSAGSPASADAFREMVNDSLQSPFGHLGPTGQGVFVSPFASAAGMNFDAVWMVGMIEGAVPPAGRPDPLLTAQEWRDAGGHDRGRWRMSDERYQYLSVVSGSARRTLSYPVTHAASQREAYPSRWFLEQASALEGRPVHTSDLASLRTRAWLTADDSAESAMNNAAANSLADEHDYRLKRLLQWRQTGGRLPAHPFAAGGPLAGAINLGFSRARDDLTEFDGNLSSLAASDRFSVGLRQAPISPTGLESWATCPYRYFLGSVLRLRALDNPEETVAISALDRGSLLHEILESFMSESIRLNALPPPGEGWGPDGRERLMRIADALFDSAESQGLTGKRLLWQMDKEAMRSDLETFLEEDARLRAEHGTSSIAVEAAFGFGGDTAQVADDATDIRFRGSIDRVDVSADGSSALVIDYKTGSASPFQGLEDDVIDRGRRLQLGVYSLAARELFPNATRFAAAYWFTTNRGGFRFAPADHFDIADDATAARFREGVSGIVSGINAGLFPANPGPPDRGSPANCRFCDFDPVCPSRRGDLWNRKKSDPALSAYLELTEVSDDTEQ